MARAGHKGHMGGQTSVGHAHVGTTDLAIPDEEDLAEDLRRRTTGGGKADPRLRKQRAAAPGAADEASDAAELNS